MCNQTVLENICNLSKALCVELIVLLFTLPARLFYNNYTVQICLARQVHTLQLLAILYSIHQHHSISLC